MNDQPPLPENPPPAAVTAAGVTPAPTADARPRRALGRRIRWWLLEGALLLAVFFGVQAWFTRDVVRGALPPLTGAVLGTSAPTVQTWRESAGRDGFVLYVWATWCGVCRAMEDNVDALARSGRLLSVAMQSGASADVQRHLHARGHDWATVNDPQGDIARVLGASAVPTILFVDRHGHIRGVTRGYTTTLGLRARLAWASLW
ncbi:MAG: redoxin family protein [Rubrivivax sp.]